MSINSLDMQTNMLTIYLASVSFCNMYDIIVLTCIQRNIMRNCYLVRLEAIIGHYKQSGNTQAYQRELRTLDSDIRRLFNRGDNVDDLDGVSQYINSHS